MKAQFTENSFLAHGTVNRDLSVFFELCNYHPKLIPGWIFFSPPLRGHYSSKVPKLGWEFVLSTFLTEILDSLLNTHRLVTWISKLVISVTGGCSGSDRLILFYLRCKL